MVGRGVEQCGTVLAGQLFGFVLQRGGLLSCGAEQVDVLHPLHGVGLVRLLKAGKKGLPQIVHVHAADGDAADALRLVGKILDAVAGGIVADEQVDGRVERPHQPVLGVGAHSVGAEGGVVRERKEPNWQSS